MDAKKAREIVDILLTDYPGTPMGLALEAISEEVIGYGDHVHLDHKDLGYGDRNEDFHAGRAAVVKKLEGMGYKAEENWCGRLGEVLTVRW